MKFTGKELKSLVDSEGLWYAVFYYLDASPDIEDTELRQAWNDAYDALKKLADLLEE